jgi:taurine dioxygenase
MADVISASELPFDAVRCGGVVGARVSGVDLRHVTAGSASIGWIQSALWRNGVLVFPGQDLSAAELVDATRLFGDPVVHPLVPHHPIHPEVIVIDSRQRQNRGRTDFWHADATFLPAPPIVTLLQSQVIPPAGGDTMFANQVLAYAGLSPGLRRLLLGRLWAEHSSDELAAAVGEGAAGVSSARHPVVRRHESLGVPALYVNAGFTRRFEGMTTEESAPLLNYLFGVSSRPELSYRHIWTAGDLLVWDNRVVQHYAVPDYGSDHRSMIRTVVLGSAPQQMTLED